MSITSDQVVTLLDGILKPQQILTDEKSCVLYSQDVYCKSQTAVAVLKPNDKHSLAKAIKVLTEADVVIVPRGGGMSYTKGYVPAKPNTVMIDMSLLNNIVEINVEDAYVTVEAGCTWQQLHKALNKLNVRTPYWGTLSGSKASIGGSVSQNSIFWGSGQHGTSSESVLALEVITSNGELFTTGSLSRQGSSPFCRHFGPDLTGLLCSDNAAFGIKTEVTLKLINKPQFSDGISFCCDSFNQQAELMSQVARLGLASEACGFDPYLQQQRMKRESLAADVKSLLGVVKNSSSLFSAIKRSFNIAIAGRRFVEAESWSVHFIVEDNHPAGIKLKLKQINKLAKKLGAQKIANTIPTVLRANPFGPVNNMIGPQGERWVPVHSLVPHSKKQQAFDMCEQVFANNKEFIDKFKIGIGYLLATVSSNVFVIEPVFFWPDELNEIHYHAIDNQYLKSLPGFARNIAAREAVDEIRQQLIDGFAKLGGSHLQLGKSYLYQQTLGTSQWQLIKAVKQQLDPNNKLNPEVLGL